MNDFFKKNRVNAKVWNTWKDFNVCFIKIRSKHNINTLLNFFETDVTYFLSRFCIVNVNKNIILFIFYFRVNAKFWNAWKDFEVRHGNEDTLREMLRIKRSVEHQYNTQVNMMSAQMLSGKDCLAFFLHISSSKTLY